VDLILSDQPAFGIGGAIDVNAAAPSGITDISSNDLIGGPLCQRGTIGVASVFHLGKKWYRYECH
jgi:hypothetical protein